MTCWRTRREVGAELHEHLRGDAFALADEAEEDVLGADVVVAELQRLAQRELEDLLRAGRERDVARRRGAAVTDDLLDLRAHGLEGDAERLEGLGGDAFALVDQPEQDVLGADVVVVEQARLFLRQDDHSAGSVGEAFEHVGIRLSSHSGGSPRSDRTSDSGPSLSAGPHPPAPACTSSASAVARRSAETVSRTGRGATARRREATGSCPDAPGLEML